MDLYSVLQLENGMLFTFKRKQIPVGQEITIGLEENYIPVRFSAKEAWEKHSLAPNVPEPSRWVIVKLDGNAVPHRTDIDNPQCHTFKVLEILGKPTWE